MKSENYYSNRAISCSDLKKISSYSINHWLYEKANPKETEALRFGRAFHSYILEPEKFNSDFLIFDAASFNSKAGEQFIKEATANNKDVVLKKDIERLKGMKQALIENSETRSLFGANKNFEFTGKYEVEKEIYWYYKRRGWDKAISCKSKPDFINYDYDFIIDLKTCAECNDIDSMVNNTIIKYNYDMQHVFYKLAVSIGLKIPEPTFIFVFIEKDEPFGIRNVTLNKDFERTGLQKIHLGFEKLIDHWNNKDSADYYGGYLQSLRMTSAPQWYRSKFN